MNQLLQIWEYIVVFVMAFIPGIEVLLVIPIAIATGLSPFWVVTVAFAGNLLAVWIITVVYERLENWWEEYKQQKIEGYEGQVIEQVKKTSKRGDRARRIWDRYGLPGLALLAPAIIGIHLAVIVALAFKSPKWPTAIWMTISLAVWSIGLGVVSFYGLSLFGWF